MTTANRNDVLRRLVRGMAAETLAGQPDRELVEHFMARGDQAAFEALMGRHGPMVYRVCWRVLKHDQDAEDAFQATFLVLARKLRAVRKLDSLASWLHGVALRTALNAKGRAAKRRRHEWQARRSQATPPDEGARGEWSEVLDSELARLDEKWRLPLILCYLEGRTQHEAAGQLGWSKNTLRRRLEEGRAALGRRLARREVVWPTALPAVLPPDRVAPAALPRGLVGPTAEAATRFATGDAVGTVSAEVAALTEGVLNAMCTGNRKVIALACALVVTLLPGGWALVPQGGVVPGAAAVSAGQPKAAPAWKERATIPLEDAVTAFSVALTPDGKTLAVGINHFDPDRSGEVALYDTATGKGIRVLEGHKELVFSLALSPDGKTLASASHDRTVKLWDVASGKELGSFEVTDSLGAVMLVTFAPDGKTLAVGRAKGPGEEGVKLLDVATGNEKARFPGFQAAFSPDGKSLATGTLDGVLKLWDVATGKETTSVAAHGGPVTFLAFSPDGKTLASVSNGDDTVKLWEVATGKEQASLGQPTQSVYTLAFSPDGRSLAVPSCRKVGGEVAGLVILWDVATGKKQATLPVHNGPVTVVAFASKDAGLAAASFSTSQERNFNDYSRGRTQVRLHLWGPK